MTSESPVERQQIDVDIACVGFGPGMGGFLTHLTRALETEGLLLQVMCYERADDIGFGVSGVVTRGPSIKKTFPEFLPTDIPMGFPVLEERVLYLLDPVGASRRSLSLRILDRVLRLCKGVLPYEEHAVQFPFLPDFMRKHDGFLLSIGQFNQWAGQQIMGSGLAQIWPGMPVAGPLIENQTVTGIRLVDQGLDRSGSREENFMPGMDVRAALTVVGDGPVGAVGQQLDRHFGMPKGHHQHDWAVGMKMVVELPEHCELKPGTVIHTLGFPEPEIFGFLYVYPDRQASLGIFVPSWFKSPVRTSYRYLQHWMMHPYVWRYLKGSKMISWGAKSLQESGRRGEPFLAGNGYARIGEGSGSTNVLTGSGVDEAWETGAILAEAVIELLKAKEPFTKENLERAYVKKRRASWVEKEGRVAEKARDGFHAGFIRGMMGMGLAGLTGGKLNMPAKVKKTQQHIQSVSDYFRGKIDAAELEKIKTECAAKKLSLHDALMEKCGWPAIPHDGQLLVSHQDALLMGGKVQAPAGYADHVIFRDKALCQICAEKICIELCSAQAITPSEDEGVPEFDREKCVHCGACLWNCSQETEEGLGNIEFRAGAGGLHSAVN